LSLKKTYSPVHLIPLLLIFLFYLVAKKVSTNILVDCGKSLEALIVILRGIFLESSLFFYVFFIMRKNSITMQSELGIYIRKIDILWGVLAYFASVFILLILNYFLPIKSTETRAALLIDYLVSNTHYYTLSLFFVYGSLLAPIAEEIIFRGFLWRILEEKKINRYMIFVVTSLLFAFFHLDFSMVPSLFISGLIFGLLKMRTNRLGVSIIAHAIGNFVGIIALIIFYS